MEGFLRLHVIDDGALPETVNTSKDPNVNAIFSQFNVTAYYQALPSSKHPELLEIYNIKCNCNSEDLLNALEIYEGTLFSDFRLAPEGTLLYDPEDLFWEDLSEEAPLWFLHKIKAGQAWDITRGNPDPYYAVHVVDVGIDHRHPDLVTEFVSDVNPLTGDLLQTCHTENNSYTSHGTSVAAFAVGETTETGEIPNGHYASIGFNTRCFGYDMNYSSNSGFLEGLDWAHEASNNGARVLTISWAYGCSPNTDDELTIQEILNNGTIIVAAAGNGNGNCNGGPLYPFSGVYDERVIIVSSTDFNDYHERQENPAGTHSHYPEVDLCAPGYAVTRCVPAEFCNGTVSNWPYRDPADGIVHSNGTSFATPIVAGTVSLMLSVNPDLCPEEVQEILKSTTDPITDAASYPNGVGTGRLNAYQAVLEAKNRWTAQNIPPISVNQIWDTDREVTGNIVVETGSTLTITSTVALSRESKIIVQRGAKLIVDAGTLTKKDCSDFWRGIEVWGNAGAEQPDPDGIGTSWQAGIVVLNGARIEYAQDAITTNYIHPKYGWHEPNFWGGVIKATNTTFEYNHRCVEFMKYDFSNKSSFTNCNFIGANDDTKGVTIWACHDIDFVGNIFDSFQSCIYGINFGANIIDGNIFENSRTAIESYTTSPKLNDEVELNIGFGGTTVNTFQDNDVHVLVESGFTMNRIRIYNNDFYSGRFGVWMDGDAKYTIKNNSFFGHSDAAVSCWQNGSNHNKVYCNNIGNSNYGVVVNGANEHLYFVANTFETTNNHDIELVKWGENNAEIGHYQGATEKPVENCFTTGITDNIFAPAGDTEPFYYFLSNAEPCYTPDNTSGNNYFNYYTFSSLPDDFCSNPDGFDGNPPIKSDLITKRIVVDNSKIAWENDRDNTTLGITYQNEFLEKEKMLDYLLKEAILQNNLVEATDLLNGENTEKAQHLSYGLLLTQNDWQGAQTALNAFPQTTQDEQNYVAVQQINLQRLQEGEDFELTQAQDDLLYQIADSDFKSRASARSLLALLKGEHFDVSLSFSGGEKSGASNAFVKEDDLKGSDYAVFPNPTNQSLTIVYPKTANKNAGLEIFNLQGRLVKSIPLKDNQDRTIIRTDGLNDGTYVLRIIDESNELYHAKLIIIH